MCLCMRALVHLARNNRPRQRWSRLSRRSATRCTFFAALAVGTWVGHGGGRGVEVVAAPQAPSWQALRTLMQRWGCRARPRCSPFLLPNCGVWWCTSHVGGAPSACVHAWGVGGGCRHRAGSHACGCTCPTTLLLLLLALGPGPHCGTPTLTPLIPAAHLACGHQKEQQAPCVMVTLYVVNDAYLSHLPICV